ncbi:MAG: phosphate ABC transporter permease PstA [Deltaproteobacteria bacterium]|jgi:phosphate transport system permease protein|nr:phosphate ABC transporter permease PstA [Deltaproteobacteria bacterium]
MKGLGQRRLRNAIAMTLCTACAVVGLGLLLLILYDVLRNGIESVGWDLFSRDPAPPGMEGGGLRSAILGQALLTITALAVGVPAGVLAGTFLSEYGRNMRLSKAISAVSDMAVSIPSIVTGAFVYAVVVKPFGGFNGWAGAAALAVIVLPIIVRTTESMTAMVPWSLREAAFALGAPYHRVIMGVVWRSAAGGIFTGVLLAAARAAGETAPLLFTSFNSGHFSLNMSKPVPSLTVTIYQYAASPYESWVSLAWGAAFAVTAAVLFLNVTGRLLIKFRQGK